MASQFQDYWTCAIVDSYTTLEFYYDVSKEVCPAQKSRIVCSRLENIVGDDDAELSVQSPAEILLWKRCCLEACRDWIQNIYSGHVDIHQCTFYPFGMLYDSGSLIIETGRSSKGRAAGLLL